MMIGLVRIRGEESHVRLGWRYLKLLPLRPSKSKAKVRVQTIINGAQVNAGFGDVEVARKRGCQLGTLSIVNSNFGATKTLVMVIIIATVTSTGGDF